MTGRRAPYVVAAAALAASAGYTLVYLYRWEWHRALVAAAFMIAIEVGLGFAVVLERIARVERRLDDGARGRTAESTRTREVLAATAPPPRTSFEWLKDAPTRTSVFIPILLGAGVVLSAIAWIVERVARATAGNALEHDLAVRLAPFTLAPGTLTLAPPAALPTWSPDAGRLTSLKRGVRIAAVIAAVVVASFAVDRLSDATQNRPDPYVARSGSRVVVTIQTAAGVTDHVADATELWGACATQIGSRYDLTGAELLDGGRVELRVRPAIGKYGERRLRGCFEDAVTDLVRAEVLELERR